MNARSLAALILLNVALMAGLVVTLLGPEPAHAQFGGASQYLMISGRVAAREQQAAVYIVNLQNSRMVAVLFNTSNNTLDVVDGRNVGQDLGAARRSR